MIDRSYLPFKSAREYVDRGMLKWMGFFISEHSASLVKEDEIIDYSAQMSIDEINLLIEQVYTNKLEVLIYTKLQKEAFKGKIEEIYENKIYFSAENQMLIIKFEEIIKIQYFENEN